MKKAALWWLICILSKQPTQFVHFFCFSSTNYFSLFSPDLFGERKAEKKMKKWKEQKFSIEKKHWIYIMKSLSLYVCVLGTVMHSVYPSLVRSYFHFAKSILICFPSHTYLPIYGDWHMHKASTRISKESVPSFPMEWREEKRTKWIERMKMWKRDVGKGI